jgi:transcriptional regulator with XRE-family HTH domain
MNRSPSESKNGLDTSGTAGGDGRVELIGRRLREHRVKQGIGVRELARRVQVSPSLISQVELGRASPSVGTLYAIVSALGLSLDTLFGGGAASRTAEQGPSARTPVVRPANRRAIQLDSGVTWELLTPEVHDELEFMFVTYPVGGASCPPDNLMRHGGHEYGYVIGGELGVTVGFETYSLRAGDAISFGSMQPHRLFTIGDQPATAVWFLVGRRSSNGPPAEPGNGLPSPI